MSAFIFKYSVNELMQFMITRIIIIIIEYWFKAVVACIIGASNRFRHKGVT